MCQVILIIFSLFVCTNQLSALIITWYENQAPGIIQRIKTDDNKLFASNYIFEFDETINNDTKNKFNVSSDGFLASLISLDREQKKEYVIPIIVKNKDNPLDKIVIEVLVVVGDVNDNEMKEGESSIKIFRIGRTNTPEMNIGRVFVNDLDDDDLNDKVFRWNDHFPVHPFKLDEGTGMIKISAITNDSQKLEEEYSLKFTVIDKSLRYDHSVDAVVNISVKTLSEESIRKSTTIRFQGIEVEQFLRTSFIGINTSVQAKCGYETLGQLSSFNESNVIEFKGNGYAVYNSISHSDKMNISLVINSYINSGIILYIGPMDTDGNQNGDSIELKLESDLLFLKLNFGTQDIKLGGFNLRQKKNHSIEINYRNNTIELVVRDCFSCPMREYEIYTTTKLPILTYPIQVGGIMEFIAKSLPIYQGFFGCISNFTINGIRMNVMKSLLNSNVTYECYFEADRLYLWLLVALVTVLTLMSIVVIYCIFFKKRKEVLIEVDTNRYFFDNSKRESGILLGNHRQSFKNDQNFY
ncbi:unnamed protein product [Diamesa serratosioi]